MLLSKSKWSSGSAACSFPLTESFLIYEELVISEMIIYSESISIEYLIVTGHGVAFKVTFLLAVPLI